MKLRLTLLSILFLTVFFGFLSARPALADSVTLSGSVKDSSSNSISGATISVNDSNNDSTTTDSSGNYSLSIPSGTYNVQVTPPSGSGLSSAVALSQNISGNTTLNFFLVQSGNAVLSGHLYDSQGNGLSDQQVILKASNGNLIQTTTDSSGNYSLQASTGTYTLEVVYPSDGSSTLTTVPEAYQFSASNFSLNQSTLLNITIPSDQVSVHIQDSSGNPVSNVQVQVPQVNVSNLSIGGNTTNAGGTSYYGVGGYSQPQTDASGNATLYLFPNTSSNPYSIIATPPSGSNSGTTTTSNIVITGKIPLKQYLLNQ
ncbi:MAG TPA: carboxypeptidase-like regulatory domain-containing protein [Candidatus Sulfotelmatobacter sp.]|jgi:hypothetical protein|nr:carboxypeptidase-like regulatory domain-containing protein [Candidatus Sulfotelmatobacter sp.]